MSQEKTQVKGAPKGKNMSKIAATFYQAFFNTVLTRIKNTYCFRSNTPEKIDHNGQANATESFAIPLELSLPKLTF